MQSILKNCSYVEWYGKYMYLHACPIHIWLLIAQVYDAKKGKAVRYRPGVAQRIPRS
jgi:hypothetical protein